MATDTQTATVLLDEATAIVEAEWMRLQQEEEDLWCAVADLFAEMPAPRPRPPRTGVTVQLQRPADRCPPIDGAGPREAGHHERSGLASVLLPEIGCLPERHCRTREVMPPSDDYQQAATRVPPTVITYVA
jgi:hypothetical protein